MANGKTQVAFFYDQVNCIGCRACEAACKQENNVPVGVRYRRVLRREEGTYTQVVISYVSLACNHCDEPACLKACPVGAYTKRPEDGIVIHDPQKCIGCKRCTWACPYGAPQFDEQAQKVAKCHYCHHRWEQGLLPACVITCPGLALFGGTLDDVQARGMATQVTAFADPRLTHPNIRFRPDPRA